MTWSKIGWHESPRKNLWFEKTHFTHLYFRFHRIWQNCRFTSWILGYTPLRFWVLKSLSSKESVEKLLLSSSLSSYSDSELDSWLLILSRSGRKLLATVFLTAPRAPDLYVRLLSSGAISRRPFFAMGQKGAQFLRVSSEFLCSQYFLVLSEHELLLREKHQQTWGTRVLVPMYMVPFRDGLQIFCFNKHGL